MCKSDAVESPRVLDVTACFDALVLEQTSLVSSGERKANFQFCCCILCFRLDSFQELQCWCSGSLIDLLSVWNSGLMQVFHRPRFGSATFMKAWSAGDNTCGWGSADL
jgi:hypothetical protein